MDGTLPALGATASHEAVYQFSYALPKSELARHGILLRSKRTRRKPRAAGRAKQAPIVGMVSSDAHRRPTPTAGASRAVGSLNGVVKPARGPSVMPGCSSSWTGRPGRRSAAGGG